MLVSRRPFVAKMFTLLTVLLLLLLSCTPSPTPVEVTHEPTPTSVEVTSVPSPVPSGATPVSPSGSGVPGMFPSIQAADLSSDPGWAQWCKSMIDLPGTMTEDEMVKSVGAGWEKITRSYMSGEVVILGSFDAIGTTLNELDCDFECFSGAERVTLFLDDTDLTISRVKVSPEFGGCDKFGSELDFIMEFNAAADALFGDGFSPEKPLAEPNYVIREPDGTDAKANPGDSGISGDPSVPPVRASSTLNSMNFVEQWGFQQIALESIFQDYSTWGEGVDILVFDASSLPTGAYTVRLDEGVSSFPPDYPPYSLCVSALVDDDPVVGGLSQDPAMDSHGLFVANLAHAVAPGSAVHLVQVLKYDEESGLISGHLFSLLNALYVYLEDARGGDTPAVVNLSLGFDIYGADLDPATQLGGAIESVRQAWGASFEEDFVVPSLEALLERYDIPGVVFVAAAGNDGKGVIRQLPASYANVIGVGALTGSEEQACFSNSGDIYAPGGGGLNDPDAGCVIDLGACSGGVECPSGVMGAILAEPWDPSSEFSPALYAYWAGTSFSTPLVSGMAALALAQGEPSVSIQERFCADPASASSGLCGGLVVVDHALAGP